MAAKIVIIGGGIIGAATAYALAAKGARNITVIEAGTLANQSSGRSFGWINASFSLDAHHFTFRHRAMQAWLRFSNDTASPHISWPGGLIWEHEGDKMMAEAASLAQSGYAVEQIDQAAFSAREPNVVHPPKACLYFPDEGVIETASMTRDLMTRARANVVSGCTALGIETHAGQVTGVRIEQGHIAADQVIVAAGTGCPTLLAAFGLSLPMLRRPGLLLRSQPVAPLIHHILASPTQELRQDPQGRLVAPTTPGGHQFDDATDVNEHPDVLATETMRRLQHMLPSIELDWQEVMLAWRPVPRDGLPVIGACGPAGMYVAVMHSGATLALLAGELLANEVLHNNVATMLSPYRPDRFHE